MQFFLFSNGMPQNLYLNYNQTAQALLYQHMVNSYYLEAANSMEYSQNQAQNKMSSPQDLSSFLSQRIENVTQEELKPNQIERDSIPSITEKSKSKKSFLKELESAKKNSESNLVNQFLSYFSNVNNSSALVMKTLSKMQLNGRLQEETDLQEVAIFFCKIISILNSRKERKYVNKSFLINFFQVQKLEKYMPDILQKVAKFETISKEEFCSLFRRCCYHFFRTVSVSSVTSSAKLNPISRPQHIKRRRLIVEVLGKK